MTEKFESRRAKNERIRAKRVRVFDSMVDLALNNVISLDEAIRRYKAVAGIMEQPDEGGDVRGE